MHTVVQKQINHDQMLSCLYDETFSQHRTMLADLDCVNQIKAVPLDETLKMKFFHLTLTSYQRCATGGCGWLLKTDKFAYKLNCHANSSASVLRDVVTIEMSGDPKFLCVTVIFVY